VLVAVRKLFRNTLFRLSLIGALLTVLSVGAAIYLVYYSMVSTEIRRVDAAMETEISQFQDIYDASGLKAIETAIALGRIPKETAPESDVYKTIYHGNAVRAVGEVMKLRGATFEGLYRVQSAGYDEGNLVNTAGEETEAAEIVLEGVDGVTYRRVAFSYSERRYSNAEFINRRARGIAGQLFLNKEAVAGIIVARDVEAISRAGDQIGATLLKSLALAAFLGLLSSLFVSRRFARRVDAFNRLATDVRAGNLDRRAPRNYSEDEMDMLAEHLNSMLDHIDRLMQAMRYAGDSVAHDLRTPLTRLRTRLESAAVELGETPEADILFDAAGDADELLVTFDSVLRIARLEAGERRELLKPLDPKDTLEDLAELYEPACEDAGLSFTFDIAKKTQILADRGLLSQAVSNLLENAIKYTPSGGRIHLSSQLGKQNRVVISISDDGPGIPSFDRERVKERFVRLDESRTLPGSGLGLALVDAIADLHRAELYMDDGLGKDAVIDTPVKPKPFAKPNTGSHTGSHTGDDTKDDVDRPGLKISLIFPRIKPSVVSKPPSETMTNE